VSIYLSVRAVRDAILPPLSSRVVKYTIDSGQLLKPFRTLSSSRDQYKPLFISCLYGKDGRRLYREWGYEGVLSIREGSRLLSRVSAYISKEDLGEVMGGGGGVFNTPYGPFEVSVERLEVVGDLSSISIDLSGGAVIRFLTPAILSPKIMIPPVKKLVERYSRLRVGTATFPTPGVVFSYALRLWNRVAPEELRLSRPNDKDDVYSYRVAVMGTALTEVVGHRIRPVTVVIGRDSAGRVRKARGFTGYVELNIHHSATRRAMERSLALANYLGLGRGRGIGLGEVEVIPRERPASGAEGSGLKRPGEIYSEGQ